MFFNKNFTNIDAFKLNNNNNDNGNLMREYCNGLGVDVVIDFSEKHS